MSAETQKLVDEINAGIEAFKKAQLQADAEVKTSVEAFGKEVKQAKEDATKAIEKVHELADRLVEAEQKLVNGIKEDKIKPKSLGQIVAESDAYKAFSTGASNRMRVEANTITGQDGESPASNSDTLVPAQRLPGINPGAFRSLRVRDVLPSGTTSSNMIEFTKENAFTNNAAETAEGYTKPESDITFTLATAPVRTIAHFIKASKQVLEDAPMLQSYIDTRMRYGVEYRIDAQLLNGNGSDQNISGITDSGNFTAFTPETGDTALDSVNRAKYLVIAADYAPTAIIMNPADWGAIERLKGSDGYYVVGNPFGGITPMLWGTPVVVSNAMTAGKFVIGAMDIAYQVFNRMGVVVEMFAQDDTNVQKNLLTIRAEARLALAVYRPVSVRYGDLTL